MNIRLTQGLIEILCLAALGIALLSGESAVTAGAVTVCLLAAVAVYYKNIPALTNISPDSPRVRTLRTVAVFCVCYVLFMAGVLAAAELGLFDSVTERMSEARLNTVSKLFMGLTLAVFMAFMGNLSPRLPYNRYAGLRLPWTVRDEETWVVAHRILGYVSLPLSILVLAGVPTELSLDGYMKFWWTGALLLYVLIPGGLSGIFYWRKFSGRL